MKPGVLLITLLLITVGLMSCEKEVHINLGSGDTQVVVEGSIETGVPPYLFLTKSLGFLSSIDLSTLEGSFVHNAKVTVTDGNQTITLKEYSLDTAGNGIKFYFYTVDLADTNFRGKVEHSYTLRIESEGKVYTAVTKIPNPKPLDSLWIKKPDQSKLDKIPEARLIFFRYTDPDTPGNYVRYYTRRNQQPYYPGINSVYDDQIVNGGSITTNINLGFDRSRTPDRDSLGIAYLNDTVTVKWCAIDRGVYRFWDSYEYAIGTVGSPFASPINLRTNITGGALGVWAGYGSSFRTIVVKD